MSVLHGATDLLRKHRPLLICEVNSENSEESTEVLRSLAAPALEPLHDCV